jgi:hypothetical protein
MSPSEIDSKLMRFGDITPRELAAYSIRMMHAFYQDMARRQYGGHETAQAFFFFKAGWCAAQRDRDSMQGPIG